MSKKNIYITSSIFLLGLFMSGIAYSAGDYLFPLAKCITCTNTWKIDQDTDDHYYVSGEFSIDLNLSSGGNSDINRPVLAVAKGKVVFAELDDDSKDKDGNPTRKEGWGYYVIIDHGNGIFSRYAHLNEMPYVKLGQEIEAGQIIGRLGSTGHSDFSHLHFGMYEILKDENGKDLPSQKYTPSQLGQYTDLSKEYIDTNGNKVTRYFEADSSIYDPNSYLSTEEKSLYSIRPTVIEPKSEVSPLNVDGIRFGSSIGPDPLFPRYDHPYIKAPITIGVWDKGASPIVKFRNGSTTPVAGNNQIITFFDIEKKTASTGPSVSVESSDMKIHNDIGIGLRQNISNDLGNIITDGSGLSNRDIVLGLSSIALNIKNGAEFLGDMSKWYSALERFLTDGNMNILQRFAGAIGDGVVVSDVMTKIKGVIDSMNVPDILVRMEDESGKNKNYDLLFK